MFPDFNIYSTPLLIFVLQGLLLSMLLVHKGLSKQQVSNVLLGILLLVSCYHRTTYTIGFMGWYDTYRNTKINYFLISLILAVGPLIYFYIKSCVQANFTLIKKDLLHFIPVAIYVITSLGIYLYDSMQIGFDETQNGILMMKAGRVFWSTMSIISSCQMLLYLALSFQLYYKYRAALIHHYSNVYNLELRWIRNFLYLFTFLFLYNTIQEFTDGFIFDLHWTQEWWFHLFSLLVVIYLGVNGFYTPLKGIPNPEVIGNEELVSSSSENTTVPNEYDNQFKMRRELVEKGDLFLDPNLSLSSLSRKAKINSSLLSKIINEAGGQNFNDFVNQYRVEHVKKKLTSSDNDHFSILSIALDAGFSSKATFNRVFKKFTGKPPSAFRN